jgi:hypothetical protein
VTKTDGFGKSLGEVLFVWDDVGCAGERAICSFLLFVDHRVLWSVLEGHEQVDVDVWSDRVGPAAGESL